MFSQFLTRPLLATAAAILALAVPGSLHAAGDLIIIGGGFSINNTAVWDAINAARLEGKPIGVFGTASSTPTDTGEGVRDDFIAKYGTGSSIYLHVTETNGAAETQAMADQIRTCGAFYFTGGDQRRVGTAFIRANGEPTLALAAIHEVFQAGGGIAGSSAGAAIMCDPMITGGNSADALLNGAFPQGSSSDGVFYDRGLGFLATAMVDQHHLSRGRLGRLIVATEHASFDLGIGIDDDSALFVDGETRWATMIGAFGGLVVDVSGARINPDRTQSALKLHFLDVGDRIHLDTHAIEQAANRTLISSPAKPPAAVTSADVWDDYEVWRLVTTLVDTRDAVLARGTDPNFDVLLRKSANTKAYRGPARTYGGTEPVYTVIDLDLAIVKRGDPFPLEPLVSSLLIVN